jgi:hypothetical protein
MCLEVTESYKLCKLAQTPIFDGRKVPKTPNTSHEPRRPYIPASSSTVGSSRTSISTYLRWPQRGVCKRENDGRDTGVVVSFNVISRRHPVHFVMVVTSPLDYTGRCENDFNAHASLGQIFLDKSFSNPKNGASGPESNREGDALGRGVVGVAQADLHDGEQRHAEYGADDAPDGPRRMGCRHSRVSLVPAHRWFPVLF